MTPDQVYDYAYDLRVSERRLAEDSHVREEDSAVYGPAMGASSSVGNSPRKDFGVRVG